MVLKTGLCTQLSKKKEIQKKKIVHVFTNPSVNMVNIQMHECNARPYPVPTLIKIKTKSSLISYYSVHVFHWVSSPLKFFQKVFGVLFFTIISMCSTVPGHKHTNWDYLAWTRCSVLLVIIAFPFIKCKIHIP